ncbi:hypothetical protein Hanom_Chr01g00019521 [Helianthus anomalus]
MMADGSYYKNKSDPLVQVLGPEHPGRARTSHTECELLMNMADRLETVAYGVAWPSTSTVIDSSPISEGCVKVEVDDIVDKHKKSEVYSITKTSEIKLVEDLVL